MLTLHTDRTYYNNAIFARTQYVLAIIMLTVLAIIMPALHTHRTYYYNANVAHTLDLVIITSMLHTGLIIIMQALNTHDL